MLGRPNGLTQMPQRDAVSQQCADIVAEFEVEGDQFLAHERAGLLNAFVDECAKFHGVPRMLEV